MTRNNDQCSPKRRCSTWYIQLLLILTVLTSVVPLAATARSQGWQGHLPFVTPPKRPVPQGWTPRHDADHDLNVYEKEKAEFDQEMETGQVDLLWELIKKRDYMEAIQFAKQCCPEYLAYLRYMTGEWGGVWGMGGNYHESRHHYMSDLAHLERLCGSKSLALAPILYNLAILQLETDGEYGEAVTLLERALAVMQGMSWGKRSCSTGKEAGAAFRELGGEQMVLWTLADLYAERGEYIRAQPLYQRALTVMESDPELNAPDISSLLVRLATLYGSPVQSEVILRKKILEYEESLGARHPLVAETLMSLAQHYSDRCDYRSASPLVEQAHKIRPSWRTLRSLAALHTALGDPEGAQLILEKALEPFMRKSGAVRSDVAFVLSDLADLYAARSQDRAAEEMHQAAFAILEKTLGPFHPRVGEAAGRIAEFYGTRGDLNQAIDFQERSNDIAEREMASALATGSEADKRNYMKSLEHGTDATLSLHVRSAPDNTRAARLAMTTILRRKGRVLDAMSTSIASLRERLGPEGQELFDQLCSTRTLLARLVVRGPGKTTRDEFQMKVMELEEKTKKLEIEISTQSAMFAQKSQFVTLETVQERIPDHAALVEFARFLPSHRPAGTCDQSAEAPRYVAYVLLHKGDPRWVDLGEAATIDRMIEEFRRALSDPTRQDVRALGRVLHERIMRPLHSAVTPKQSLLLSPDGLLNLVPFAALVHEEGGYIIERFGITYLTSGRDLLRQAANRMGADWSLIVADPDFEGRASKEVEFAQDTVQNRRSADSAARFDDLPGTAEEARALQSLLPGPRLLLGEKATESAIKEANHPTVLHVATHGFFLRDRETIASHGRGVSLSDGERITQSRAWTENPLLRSGLALAGANVLKSHKDDGILTALEASGLDLWGTKLVVLSACETGIGEVQNGEGVYGLRRALVMAGAESQVISLWKVSDEATRDLMIDYYHRLNEGEDRSEALRQAQQKTLARPGTSHPFYWASFIPSGNGGPL